MQAIGEDRGRRDRFLPSPDFFLHIVGSDKKGDSDVVVPLPIVEVEANPTLTFRLNVACANNGLHNVSPQTSKALL